ncbi:MAG: ABC transporter substrate-binding protein [Opitutales bacterium]
MYFRDKGLAITLCALLVVFGACADTSSEPDLESASWPEIEAAAEATTVYAGMWTGDALINAYMQDYVVPELRKRHGIELRIVSSQGSDTVNRLLADREAGRDRGDLDLVWINGETFYQLREIEALYGPFTEKLPNNALVDWENPLIASDFQQPVNGFEAPWGNVQFTLIYHTERVAAPPRTLAAFASWVRANPGRFSLPNDFAGMTFLKGLLAALANDERALQAPFDEAAYNAAANRLFAYLEPLRPLFWRGGETYPANVAALHRLFANGEVDFTMSNNDGEVDNKVFQGVLPEPARAFVPEYGSIQNTHYWGIPYNASNKAGALVVINFLQSPEAQWEKQKPATWGDGTVLAVSRLPEPWPDRFSDVPGRTRAPARAEIQERALAEPPPEVMIRLFDDFRRRMIEAPVAEGP